MDTPLHRANLAARLAPACTVLMLSISACGGSEPSPAGDGSIAAPLQEVTAMFVLPRLGVPQNFFDTPFPTDLRRDMETGHPNLDGWPEAVNVPVLKTVLGMVEETDGFALNTALYFRFDGAIDADRLPGPDGTDRVDSPVLLMDVDPDSPELGRLFPLLLDFRTEATNPAYRPTNTLAIIPVGGVMLREGGRYATVVTHGIRDLAGRPVRRTNDMEAVLGTTAPADPTQAAAWELHAPAVAILETMGVSRDRIASIGLFTTMHVVDTVPMLREFLYGEIPEPEPVGLSFLRSTNNTRVFVGRYASPDIQLGEPPYSPDEGMLLIDHDGKPYAEETDLIRFAVSVPDDPPSHGGDCYPIVVYGHGTGGDYRSFEGNNPWDESEVLGSRGMAVISLDLPMHGERGTTDFAAKLGTFDPTNPPASVANIHQGNVDNFQLVRMITSLERPLVIPAGLDPTGTGACFDAGMIMYMGHSQGAIASAFLAFEPTVRAVVLSGAGGGIQSALFDRVISLETGNVLASTIVATFLNTDPESFNLFHPAINALAMAIEPAEPMNYMRLVLRPPPGLPIKSIHVTEGMSDMYTPPLTAENLATAIGLAVASPPERIPLGIALLGPAPVSLPASGNAAGGLATAVLVQYPGENHFAIYNNADAARRYGEFLRTFTLDGVGVIPD